MNVTLRTSGLWFCEDVYEVVVEGEPGVKVVLELGVIDATDYSKTPRVASRVEDVQRLQKLRQTLETFALSLLAELHRGERTPCTPDR